MIRLAGAYLKKCRKVIAVYIGIVTIFFVVFFLSSVPVDTVQYAAFLSAVLMCIVGIIDFADFVRRSGKLHDISMQQQMELSSLPKAKESIEDQYQELLIRLEAYRRELESEAEINYQEMVDYYTLWAHQIKTPIAAMKLLNQSDQIDRRAMEAELFKTEQYVEMVLSYLRAGNLSSDLVLQRYFLDEIAKKAIRKYSSLFILKKIELEFHPSKVEVLTDERWAVFVVEQILSNALKYTKKGKIIVQIKGDSIIVQDTGIGISREDLPRVMEKGFTGYNGRQDRKSTGIVLYLCKKIMKKLGHLIEIESEVGKGTTVILNFGREFEIAE